MVQVLCGLGLVGLVPGKGELGGGEVAEEAELVLGDSTGWDQSTVRLEDHKKITGLVEPCPTSALDPD